MRVLIGCEFSGIVRDAFIAQGHKAWSCDLNSSDGENRHHLRIDIFQAIKMRDWDLIILHPPCTALCVAGNGTYAPGGVVSDKRRIAIRWTRKLFQVAINACQKVALENPVGVLSTAWRPPDQYVQPWQYGHMETKKTGLWLHNLPKLVETENVYDEMMLLPKKERHRIWYASPGDDRGKERSRFYPGIAKAMADQW